MISKITAALKVIWELWPYIMSAIESGKKIRMDRKVSKGKNSIRVTFEDIQEKDDENAAQDIARFNDLFRK
jgi:cytochrome c biogenesis factor